MKFLGWRTITFPYRDDAEREKAREKAVNWQQKNKSNYQIVTIYVNNAYAFEYRCLLKL